jgi:hypothetical protein
MLRGTALTALAAIALFLGGCKTCGNLCGGCGGGCGGDHGCHAEHGCAQAVEGVESLPEPAQVPPAETVPQPPPAEAGGIY